jgi:UDP-3-O-[3-hydroxymyristoyl] glucosamine N-acyltransferase
MTVSELAEKIGATVIGDGSAQVQSANTLEDAGPGQISFLANPKYEKLLNSTRASAVIAGEHVRNDRVTLLRTPDPYFAFMQAVEILHGHRKHPFAGVHPAAHVDPTATIGEGSVLYPGVYVGPRAVIGRDCILYPNSVVYDDCILKDSVILQAGSVIGQDGFGYATHKGKHHKIPQIGNVILEEDVEVGANVAIQRATLGSTIIGRGTKMSDLISIGHAAKIGPDGLVVSLVGIAGSTRIGHHAIIGGQAGVVGHVTVGDNVSIAAKSGVINDVPDKSVMIGAPATSAPHGRKMVTIMTQLPELLDRVRRLEQELEKLRGE